MSEALKAIEDVVEEAKEAEQTLETAEAQTEILNEQITDQTITLAQIQAANVIAENEMEVSWLKTQMTEMQATLTALSLEIQTISSLVSNSLPSLTLSKSSPEPEPEPGQEPQTQPKEMALPKSEADPREAQIPAPPIPPSRPPKRRLI